MKFANSRDPDVIAAQRRLDAKSPTGVRIAANRRVLVLSLCTLIATGSAIAQDLDPTREQVSERNAGFLDLWEALRARQSGLRIRLEPGLVSSGKFDGARLTWYRAGLSAAAGLPLSERANLGVSPSFAFERLVLKGSDAFAISPGGRDTDVSSFLEGSVSVGGNYRFDRGWGAEISTRASFRQETGAAFEEALQIGGSVAATYSRGKWLRLRLGVGLGTDIGDQKLKISPVYRVVIRPIPELTLETSGLSGSIGWDVTKSTLLTLEGGVDGSQYKLEKRSGFGDGSLQRRQAAVSIGTVYRAASWLRVGATLGIVFEQELTVLDQAGRETEERTDKSPSANFGIRIEFRL